MKLSHRKMETPIGVLKLVASNTGLVAVLWAKESLKEFSSDPIPEDGSHPILKAAVGQLEEYFGGKRKEFDLPLEMRGTEFQKKVWRNLLKISYGKTASYGDLAKAIGNPKACRAVGAANGQNPIPIIVPCHRVIGSNGALTGFAGGLKAKKILLDHEQIEYTHRA